MFMSDEKRPIRRAARSIGDAGFRWLETCDAGDLRPRMREELANLRAQPGLTPEARAILAGLLESL